jgi:hypothetical protein
MTWQEVIGLLVIWVVILWVTPLGSAIWAEVVNEWNAKKSRRKFKQDNPEWRQGKFS